MSESGNLAWLCWPDFDFETCFSGLLGTAENGIWSIAPEDVAVLSRSYLPGTNVLDTRYSSGLAPERGPVSCRCAMDILQS
jgi:hypothetical protein